MPRYTIFTTPVLKTFLRIISLILLKTLRWKAIGPLPEQNKYIIIVAPHTSNWDVFYGVILAFALKLDARFLAKKELFRWPFAPIIRWLGGIATDRSSHSNIVDKIINTFNQNEKFVLALAPEGTRHKVDYWKSGFYHIATGANIPIVLAFIDFGTKTGGAGPLLYPSGDINKDMATIRNFYLNKKGKNDDQTSPAAIPT
ncbi:MAG: lysophospholipid acyltransferase family protein [Syntrophaceae bacterium]|nr:lysophospholipid acyltransferase family protein [Syntrophaceae bacterium]